ncbi:MAG: hypothetical protein JO368_04390 [Acidimicrobiales bacterium]|nr:hypothetical protein [Acidimicrobiales bacterium]
MSDGPDPGWWQASDGRWYPPEQAPRRVPARPPSPADASRPVPHQPSEAVGTPLPTTTERAICSFCRKSQDQVRKIVAGPDGVYICDECVNLCRLLVDPEPVESA